MFQYPTLSAAVERLIATKQLRVTDNLDQLLEARASGVTRVGCSRSKDVLAELHARLGG